jgi:DNA repair photolyase
MRRMGGEKLFELRRRTFDTPQFRGIEFIEVEAKSIINHVPGSYLPFNWTINPYRGCSHACVYCVSADTPILMVDGRMKTIADIRVGDRVYGTERRGAHRRYVASEVLNHWRSLRPAYRITLEDGTRLVSSADHRFLSDRGWKHVTGAECGDARRPHLTLNNRLMGTGGFAPGPYGGAEYRRGYLRGLIRGDGHVRSYSYARSGRSSGDVHPFPLALVDIEALRRGRAYLSEVGDSTREFVFQEAAGEGRVVTAIGASSRAHVEAVREAIRWPPDLTLEWAKGFLAGIFDAEGSYSGGSLRIANTDPVISSQIEQCLQRFAFRFTTEPIPARNGVTCVRLLGGLREHLRFFHTVDPAVTRKRSIAGRALENTCLRVVSIEPLGIELPMFDIATTTGDFIANGIVSHNCFARTTHTYMDLNAGRDFETKIYVKVNAPQLLRKELRVKRWKGDHVAMGTATDPYQRAEGRYRLMPGIIEALAEVRNPFSILTKGTIVLRDLDLLAEAATHTDVSTALSIGTLDEDAWRRSEPGTPHPRKRIEVVARLNAAGVPCGVMVAPVLPGITDGRDQIKEVIAAALDAGATHVSPILLHLRPGVKEVYMAWLEDNYPELVARYMSLYASSSYASSRERDTLGATVSALAAEHPARPRSSRRPPRRFDKNRQVESERSSQQLRLL